MMMVVVVVVVVVYRCCWPGVLVVNCGAVSVVNVRGVRGSRC